MTFFFRAEDGIRDGHVTGVQTCALPILSGLPSARCLIWPDLEQDEIILAAEVLGHLRECFPINPFVVDAEAAPRRFVLEDLIKQTCDARSGFTRARIAGDQPAATEIVSRPAKTSETDNDMLFRFP